MSMARDRSHIVPRWPWAILPALVLPPGRARYTLVACRAPGFRQFCRAILSCSGLFLAPLPAWPAGVKWTLPADTVRFEMGDAPSLYGVAAEISHFESPLDVPRMLAHLESHHPWLGDLAVLPGMAVLAGVLDGCTLAATVTEVAGARSAGTLSRICWPDTAVPVPAPPDWLPAGAAQVFDFASHDEQGRMAQQVWRHPARPAALWVMLRRRLADAGWMPVPAGARLGESWRRMGRQLTLDVVPAGEGGAVVAWMHDEADHATKERP